MFKKGAFVGKYEFWRYQNAWYNNKNCFSALLLQISEVLLFATIQVEFWATNEEVKLDVELHDIITGLYPMYEALQCGDSQFKVSELCQWHSTAKRIPFSTAYWFPSTMRSVLILALSLKLGTLLTYTSGMFPICNNSSFKCYCTLCLRGGRELRQFRGECSQNYNYVVDLW